MIDSEALKRQMMDGAQAVRKVLGHPYQLNARQKIFEQDNVSLYHYHAKSAISSQYPTLIVFATVNRPEILDLFPEKSFIHHLLSKGQDVYLLDWGYAKEQDRDISFEDYITTYLATCVNQVKKNAKADKVNLIGICQGGLISLCYTAVSKAVNKLTLISTPIDFQTKNNLISQLIKQIDINEFKTVNKNVSGLALTNFFISLRPFDLLGKKYLRFLANYKDEESAERFMRIEKWLYDAPDQPRKAFADFLENFYQENKLIDGSYKIGTDLIKLDQIKTPVLNIVAKNDEIIPPAASLALKKYLKSDNYFEKKLEGGHISIYMSEKTCKYLASAITRWFS